MPEAAIPEPYWLVEEWSRQLTRVIDSMTGESPIVAHSIQPPPDGELLWWEQKFSLGPKAIAWAGAVERTWEEIGSRMLRSAGVEDGTKEDIRGSYLEIVQQVMSGIAGALSGKAGKEVACESSAERAPSHPDAPLYTFEISMGGAEFRVVAMFSPELFSNAQPAPPPLPEPAAKPSLKPVQSNSIDLLLDVELPVSVSFGRAQLPLKDVIKLTTGSIVELNRAVSEPVDIIVNNCVIARGEVVVVEGNFGVRIKQVISRQERLRTLY